MLIAPAVAVGMAFGPAAGLKLVDVLTEDPLLRSYPLLRNVRGDLLAKLSRFDVAHAEFERAASIAENLRERDLLLHRVATAPSNRSVLTSKEA